MERKAKIVLGTPDPVAMRRPNVELYQSDEFREELIKGMAEAKEIALRRQAAFAAHAAEEKKAASK